VFGGPRHGSSLDGVVLELSLIETVEGLHEVCDILLGGFGGNEEIFVQVWPGASSAYMR
jgi:hypothetical protein